jgi:ribosomal protein S18 acetylase RimI-like enzyme
MTGLTIVTATINDIPQLLSLVNSAYRGEDSKKGWTTEAFLLEGNQRIDEATLEQMMQLPGARIKKCLTDSGQLVGCVYLEPQAKELYVGLLTVSPLIQTRGIGKTLLKAAEEYASEQGCTGIAMTVISLRQELIDWYLRRGYQLTGEVKPFPTNNKFGTPIRPLAFVVLKKTVVI